MSSKQPSDFLVIGLHPTIDRTIAIEHFRPGGVIRGKLLMAEPGGKGTNVIRDLTRLGHCVKAVGFLGRWEAEYFLAGFDPKRVISDFAIVNSPTRQPITLIETATGSDTHIIAGKLHVRQRDVAELLRRVKRHARPGQCVVLSGSLPGGMTGRDYRKLLELCRARGMRLCVDTSGPMLRAALDMRPWALKPNRHELEELVGRRLPSRAKILAAARGLLGRCPNILVSLGAEGALLVTAVGAWRAQEKPAAPVVHTVGSGDALFSGFLSALARGKDPADALRFAVACGSACVRSRYAALQSVRAPRELLKHVAVLPL